MRLKSYKRRIRLTETEEDQECDDENDCCALNNQAGPFGEQVCEAVLYLGLTSLFV